MKRMKSRLKTNKPQYLNRPKTSRFRTNEVLNLPRMLVYNNMNYSWILILLYLSLSVMD